MEGGGQAVALKLAQLGGDKWLHSKRPTGSGSRRQALGSETSNRARKGLVEMGHEQLCLNWHGWVETSGRARKGQVEVGDKWLCLNGCGWMSDQAREVMIDKQSG